jgi:hypothetical protein
MKKTLIILLFFAGGFSSLLAQQSPHFTQYMFNDYVINPAIAGTNDYRFAVTTGFSG